MTDLDDRYYQVPWHGAVYLPGAQWRYFKVIVVLISGYCLLLLSVLPDSVSSTALRSVRTGTPVSLIGLPGFTRSPRIVRGPVPLLARGSGNPIDGALDVPPSQEPAGILEQDVSPVGGGAAKAVSRRQAGSLLGGIAAAILPQAAAGAAGDLPLLPYGAVFGDSYTAYTQADKRREITRIGPVAPGEGGPERGQVVAGWGGRSVTVPFAVPNSRMGQAFQPPSFPKTWPYAALDFDREDRYDDARFYDEARLVEHIDDPGIQSIREFYKLQFAEAPQGDYNVLDLCSSWVSHYPEGLTAKRVAITGMMEEELKENKQATEWVRRDLNKEPTLPYESDTFDFVTNVFGVEYLTKPQPVWEEMNRVLKPRGVAIVIFSNRCFAQKAIRMWYTNLNDGAGHANFIGTYFKLSPRALWKNITAIDISPNPGVSDPVWAVTAIKLNAFTR